MSKLGLHSSLKAGIKSKFISETYHVKTLYKAGAEYAFDITECTITPTRMTVWLAGTRGDV